MTHLNIPIETLSKRSSYLLKRFLNISELLDAENTIPSLLPVCRAAKSQEYNRNVRAIEEMPVFFFRTLEYVMPPEPDTKSMS